MCKKLQTLGYYDLANGILKGKDSSKYPKLGRHRVAFYWHWHLNRMTPSPPSPHPLQCKGHGPLGSVAHCPLPGGALFRVESLLQIMQHPHAITTSFWGKKFPFNLNIWDRFPNPSPTLLWLKEILVNISWPVFPRFVLWKACSLCLWFR